MSPQQTIAHYRVISKLGEGGMGAVYRATDTKLNRDVAIKILPDVFASDADRLARFTREAQVLAQLNHPNIASIYGVEERAIVMELAEGESPIGPLTVEESLPIIEQLIDALEYAHDKGIVHRDLKPANLKLTRDGRLKVLDFGLAKALSSDTTAARAGDATKSPTLSMRATMADVIMGTPAYMSPEQARGQSVDKRADIWSFGVVVYELLTGKSLFDGGTVSDTLAAVLRQDLDLTNVPPRFRRLLAKCLTRDPRQRLRDISGARLLLEEFVADGPAEAPATRYRWLWPAVSGVLLLSTALLSVIHLREMPPTPPVVRSSIAPPENARLVPTSMAMSPDGRRVAFTVRSNDGKAQLWIRPLDSLKPQPLAGTDGATFPFWSPDGKSIGFFANSKLNRMDLTSGLILTLADTSPAGNVRGAAWSPAGVILFASSGGPLKKISASGGQVTDASKIASGEKSHRWPCFLPDGTHYVFLAGDTNSTARRQVRLGALNSIDSKPLMESDSEAIYSAGHLLFMLANTLMAQPFDTARLVLAGEPKPLAEGVALAPVPGKGGFSPSLDGLLVYGSEAEARELRWLDREGRSLGPLGEKGYFESLSFSADHKTLVVTGGNDNREISVWLVDVAKGTRQRLTTGPSDQDVVLSADGSTVFFTSHHNGRDAIYRKTVNGSGVEELLVGDQRPQRVSSITPDNKNLLLRWASEGKVGFRILPDPLGPVGAKPYVFLASPFDQSYGEFSPDGKWIAYESGETGRPELYVVSFPGGGDKLRISTAGGFGARWRADGKEIFYLRPDFMLMAVEVGVHKGKMETGTARELFRLPPHVTAGRDFGVSADGQRILAIMPAQESAPSLTLVQNWVSRLNN